MRVTIFQLITVKITFAFLSNGELPCEFLDSINISNGTRHPDGSIVFDDIRYESSNYAWIDYDLTENGTVIDVPAYARGCVCQVKSCVWLCCTKDFIQYGEPYPTCFGFNESAELPVKMDSGLDHVEVVDLMAQRGIFKALRSEQCDDLTNAHSDEWNMDKNGHVNSLHSVKIRQHEYCLLQPAESSEETELYYCPQTVMNGGDKNISLSYSSIIGIVLSIPFLVATLLIYACIPDLRNIHGKSLICYVLALTIAYVVLLLINFNIAIIPCNVQGYVLYFSVLVSFFWLNVMCFDIFWTFSSGVVIKNERKRFIYYSIYAWGSPMFILGLALLFDHTDLVEEEYRPRFGMEGCFIFHDKLVECLYFYLPLLLLVVANLYFFVVTAIRIIRIQHATDAALRNDSRRHSKFEKDRYRFSLYLRLFIVMGVTWTFEILSWAVGSNDWFFYLSDTCNCLLGVIIFFLFVWKQKVKQLVVKRISTRNFTYEINVR
ncbi:G-protein coupled receptor Mth2-like isoform X3 [Toxorhynchites rutilus septentrionalis]|uniref:G-protein coupled receptor Mth2-like isoform X3 n=1 Tax=Toxorhynchites rutilus septentrionalis TaxID=329112 RepID=UPI00247A02F9|nr:G-protein coupled receptor Mth2-like isoform X3 [Toxorhynchites rutilus septentrionalis]